MNIECVLMINGELTRVSGPLQDALTALVDSYIKNKVFTSTVTEEKPKAKRFGSHTPKKKMTPEEVAQMTIRAGQLQHLVLKQAMIILSKEFHRSWGGTYSKLKPLIDSGQLKFQPKHHV